jgi:integrase
MSPERTSPNGRYRTDWTRKEIGRIRVTYGYTLKEHQRAIDLLEELYDNDQHAVLRALKDRKVTIRELLAQKKAGRIRRDDVLVDLRLQRPLWTTFLALAAKRPGGEPHRRRVADSVRRFQRTTLGQQLGADATIAQLAAIEAHAWFDLRQEYASPADWNHLRKALSQLLAALLETHEHAFRKTLLKRLQREKEPALEVDVTTDQFWALVEALPEHVRAGIVTLAVTGMRLNTEYLKCREHDKRPELHAIYCPGSKNADASGLIPVAPTLWSWVDLGIPAPLQHRRLREQFHRAAIAIGLGRMIEDPRGRVTVRGKRKGEPLLVYDGLRLHDLRHLALQLALEGGAKLNEVQAFARHADPRMTMRYLTKGNRQAAADAIGRALTKKPKRKGA